MERIDGLLEAYAAVLSAVRPRMDEKDLNRDYSTAIERLRYDPDAIQPTQWKQEDVMHAAQEIMKRFTGRKSKPPMS